MGPPQPLASYPKSAPTRSGERLPSASRCRVITSWTRRLCQMSESDAFPRSRTVWKTQRDLKVRTDLDVVAAHVPPESMLPNSPGLEDEAASEVGVPEGAAAPREFGGRAWRAV